jgi:hypothetical protein
VAIGNNEVFKQSAQVNNVVVPGSDVLIFGKGNAVSPGVKGVVIGDGQILEQDGMVVPNLTVTESINGAPVVGYKRYIALINQTGVSAPTATVFENTIGDITFNYIGVGTYEILLTGAFLADKTWVVGGSADINAGGGDFATLDIRRYNDDSIRLYTYDNYTISNNMLVNTAIEIRVY